jgi:hypothetical protein
MHMTVDIVITSTVMANGELLLLSKHAPPHVSEPGTGAAPVPAAVMAERVVPQHSSQIAPGLSLVIPLSVG